MGLIYNYIGAHDRATYDLENQIADPQQRIESTWPAPDRGALRRVLTMELSGEDIEAMMAEVSGAELSYHYRIYDRRK